MLLKSRIVRIAAASLLSGALIGVVGALFRLALIIADRWRGTLIAWAVGQPYLGWFAPLMLAASGAALARMLVVRFAPEAEGSGVQRVEAEFKGEVKAAGAAVIPVKFVGGVAAIGCGLALGREGPTVQMGSSLATLVGGLAAIEHEDARVIDAAGAGAGLAVAFNAPLGGAIFVFEELTSRFTSILLVAALAAAFAAVRVMRLMLGDHMDFAVKQVSFVAVWRDWPFLSLGVLLGVVGAFYNWIIIRSLRFADSLLALGSIQRAAVVGAVVGLAGWFAPRLIGGGDNVTQAVLSGGYSIRILVIVFAFRFLIGPWSYASGTPGGLFAPMLVLGATMGALLGGLMNYLDPNLSVTALDCAIVGMGAFFSACVRAPLTGIMLTVEMTGRADLSLALLGGSLAAVAVAMLLKSEPIYTTLRRLMRERP